MLILKNKKLIPIFIFLILLGYLTSVYAGTLNSKAADGQNPSEIRNILETQMPTLLRKYNIPGTAIAVIEDGKIEWSKGYGMADKASSGTMDADTVFQVASCSKSVTAWGIMKLVEEGRLELDAPVERYLKRWHLPYSEFDNSKVTIRRLLSHTAGFSYTSYPGIEPGEKLSSLEQSLSGKAGVKVIYEPGEKFLYSGAGYTLLQLVIEEVAGMDFSQYMHKEILKPLGMDNSSFDFKPEMKNKSAAYGFMGQQLPNYIFTEKAAAGLYSTAKDMAKFAAAYAGKAISGNSILNEKSLSLMYIPEKESYGLGCSLATLPGGAKIVWHSGVNRGWCSQFAISPESGDGIVVLTNSDNGQNLITETISLWSQWKTGSKPEFYYDFKKQADIAYVITLILAAGAVIYLAITGLNLRSRRIRSCIGAIKKHILRLIMHTFIPLIGMILWYTFFYTGTLTGGWAAAAFMPAGFGWMTLAVMLWGVLLAVNGLFVKQKLHVINEEKK